MANYIILFFILVIAGFSIKGYIKKITHGCCGGEIEPNKRKKVNLDEYKISKIVNIEGMTCKNCAIHIENELNDLNEVYAKVNLKKKYAVVNMKNNLSDDIINNAVKKAGYSVLSIIEK